MYEPDNTGAGWPVRAALALVCGFAFALCAPAVAQVSAMNDAAARDAAEECLR
jgi:hypothetical protein